MNDSIWPHLRGDNQANDTTYSHIAMRITT